MTAIRLRPHDLGRDDGCEECDAGIRAGVAFFLVERPTEATDRVLCARCVARLHPDLPMPIGTSLGGAVQAAGLAETVSEINGASKLLEEAPRPAVLPCPFPREGDLFRDGGQLYRVIEVKRSAGHVSLVLRDLDNPHHTQTKEVKE